MPAKILRFGEKSGLASDGKETRCKHGIGGSIQQNHDESMSDLLKLLVPILV
jgi:hypothetical protein